MLKSPETILLLWCPVNLTFDLLIPNSKENIVVSWVVYMYYDMVTLDRKDKALETRQPFYNSSIDTARVLVFNRNRLIDWLFVVFHPVENISLILRRHHCWWRAANLDLCLALMAFSSEGYLACHTCCNTGPPFLRSHPKDPWFSLLNAELLAMEQSLPIFTS